MMRKYLKLLCLVCMYVPVFAQVDLPTGKANFTLPLVKYSDANRLSLLVQLNYTGGGGILVNEIPTAVGLGWELSTGGKIVRSTAGEADDQKGGVYGGDYYAAGLLYSSYDNLSPLPQRAGYVPLYPFTLEYYRPDSTILADREQDQFIFEFNGRKGVFVIDRFGNIISLDDSRLRIEKLEKDMVADGILSTISGFIITDENGIRYTFSALETNKIISYQKGPKLTTSAGQNLSTQNYKISNYSVVNSWQLTEITDPLSANKIVFTYDSYNLQYQQAYEAAYTESVIEGKQENVTQTLQLWASGQKKRISSISLPTGATIGFTYSDTEMVDLPGQKPLRQVTLSNTSSGIVYGYQLGYAYFSKDSLRNFGYSFPTTELKYARLTLRSIQKFGRFGSNEPPYVFDYITSVGGIVMPGRLLGGQDHFGYFNNVILAPDYGSTDKTYTSAKVLTMPVNREVSKFGAATLGALRTITYPTRGIMEFAYENNTADDAGNQALSGGIRVRQVIQYPGTDTSQKIIRQYNYNKEDGSSSGWGYEVQQYNDTSVNYVIIPNSPTPYSTANMSYSIASGTINQIFGSRLVNFYQIAGTLAYNTFLTIVITAIASIFNPPASTKQLMIPAWQQISNHPSKFNPLPHLYSRVEEVTGTQQQNDNIGKTVYDFTSPSEFPVQVPVQKAPYIARRCVPWLYGLPLRVTVKDKSDKLVSQQTNSYSSTVNQTGGSGSYSVRYRASQVLICPENLFQTYAAGGVKLVSDYTYPLSGRTELSFSENRKYDSSGLFVSTKNTFAYDNYYHQPKTIVTLNSRNDTLTEKVYYASDYSASSFQVAQNLVERNIFNLPVSRETWLSTPEGIKLVDASASAFSAQANGDIKVEKMLSLQTVSPLKANEAGTFDGSTFNHMPNFLRPRQILAYNDAGKLVATYEEEQASGYQWDNNNQVVAVTRNAAASHSTVDLSRPIRSGSLSSNGNEYKTFQVTLASPGAIALKLEVPTGESRSCSYSIAGPVVRSGLLSKVTTSGRLSELWNSYKGGDASVCFGKLPAGTYTIALHNFIWNPQPAAPDPITTVTYSYSEEPVTLHTAEFFYNGFEDSTYQVTAFPFAGKKYYPGAYQIPFIIPNGRNYIVDYRYLQGASWVYASKPYSNSMILSDGQGIDEVRVYPRDAQITTYTYEAQVGITSENGSNGITVFYEYDNLGRLSFVRDEKRNILKRICCNYSGEVEICGGKAYGNMALQQTFTRQNCGAGYTSGDYLYQVPASRYTADDQGAADAMAKADVQRNGQNAANQFGSCSCSGEDRAVIGTRCEKGLKETFIEETNGGTKCRQGYWYKFSDGSHSAKVYGAYVVCP